MSDLLGGILLPSSVLSSAWVECLAAFVALNTLIYVGLTLAKLTRWPTQLHPEQVRTLTARASVAPLVGPLVPDAAGEPDVHGAGPPRRPARD